MSNQKTRARSSDIRAADVVRVLEAAEWTTRVSGNHVVLTKNGVPSLTLSDPVHKNNFPHIAQALGVSYRDILQSARGKGKPRGVASRVWIGRLDLAKRLRAAGFASAFIDKTLHLRALYARGFRVEMLEAQTAEQIVAKLFKKPVIMPPSPAPEALPKEPAPTPAPSLREDELAVLGLLGEIQQDVKALHGADAYKALAARREEKLRAVRRLTGVLEHVVGELKALFEGDPL